MIIDAEYKLWLLTEQNRMPVLAGANYDKAAHTLTVTNGKALIIVPVRDDEDDESGIIPADALKEAEKLSRGRAALPCEVKTRGGAALLRDGRSYPLIAGQFPNTEQVIPNRTGWMRPVRIMFSAELLLDLVEAAGADKSRFALLEFNTRPDGDSDGGPILVTTGKAKTAVFMPCRMGVAKEAARTSADVKEDAK